MTRAAPHPITLQFQDRQLEWSYRTNQVAAARIFQRWLYALVGVVWIANAWVDMEWFHIPAQQSLVLRLVTGIPVVLALAATWASTVRFARLIEPLGIALLLSLVVGIYGVQLLRSEAVEDPLNAVVVGLIYGLSAGPVGMRLRMVPGALTNVALVGTYVIFAAVRGHAATVVAINTFLLTNGAVFGLLVLYLVEAANRRVFLRGLEVEEARRESDALLHEVLPHKIALRLKARERTIADRHQDVTVLFADIVGFTTLSQRLDAATVVSTLDEVFTAFDEIATRLGLEKIKTIGDAYMVAGGLPDARDDHAEAVAAMALEMQAALQRCAGLAGEPVSMRVGIHSGPVVAGVIGKRKFLYDLWGDTVNTASRMESHGVPGSIQVSEAVAVRLEKAFQLRDRGIIEVKGKGPMRTYFLVGRRAEEGAA